MTGKPISALNFQQNANKFKFFEQIISLQTGIILEAMELWTGDRNKLL